MTEENTPKTSSEHFYWLDAIRFIAAFMVVLSHSRNDFFLMYSELPSEQHNIFSFLFTLLGRLGHEAVIVFFVLSGFLVGGRGLERIASGTFKLKSYAIDRFSRIYPPLLASVLFFFVTTLFVPDLEWNTLRALGNIFSLQCICCKSLVSPFWTLSFEVWFYIVLGSLALFFAEKSIKSFILAILTIGVFMLGEMTYHYLFLWFIGAMAYLSRPKTKNNVILILSIIGMIAGVVLYQLSKDTYAFNIPFNISNIALAEMPLTISMALFVQQIILHKPEHKFSIVVESFFGNMAKFSYSLYLSHRIVLLWVFCYMFKKKEATYSVNDFVNYAFVVIICLVVCWCQYMLSERYTPQIKKYLKQKFNCN